MAMMIKFKQMNKRIDTAYEDVAKQNKTLEETIEDNTSKRDKQ